VGNGIKRGGSVFKRGNIPRDGLGGGGVGCGKRNMVQTHVRLRKEVQLVQSSLSAAQERARRAKSGR